MRTLHVLIPPTGTEYAGVARAYLDPYLAAFAARGLNLVAQPWTEALAQGGTTPTLALFAWGYHFDVARWEAMLECWPAERPLFNPPALLRWNTRKTYLRELAAAGIPVVPSRFGDLDDASAAAAFAAFGCDELVAKPQVSAGSWQTVRLARGDPVPALVHAIVQPFVPAIGEEGELSFLFVGGVFSHAVRKVAAPGDFRIQPQFGGVFSRFDPSAHELTLAKRVIAAAPLAPLYARVDLIRMPGGDLALMELELIEPDLYVAQEPALPARLADAVLIELNSLSKP